MKRLILSLSALFPLILSGCAHSPRGVGETCLPVPGQNMFHCERYDAGKLVGRDIPSEGMQGFGCFPLEDIKSVFKPKEK